MRFRKNPLAWLAVLFVAFAPFALAAPTTYLDGNVWVGPSTPTGNQTIAGQLWVDTSTQKLKYLTAAGSPATVSLGVHLSTIPVNEGGTAATSASAARTNLGLAIGSDVEAWDADLDTWAGISPTAPSFTTVDLGAAATDTTLSRTAAGKIAIEGKAVPLMSGASDVVFSGPTAARTITLPDSDQTLLYSGGALGTPASGTLTNCDSLPVSGITASTSTALGVGSIELGHASDTTIARSGAGAITIEGVAPIMNGGALGTPSSGTLTNCSGYPVPAMGSSFMCPPGFFAAGATASTALATTHTQALYLGKAFKANPTFDIVQKIPTTAGSSITWAEVGIATGTPSANANSSLTTRGSTSVASTYNSTGVKKTTVTTSGISQGDDVWVLWGAQATTVPVLRGGVVDDIQSGMLSDAVARPSTMGAGTTFTIAGATVVPAWTVVVQR